MFDLDLSKMILVGVVALVVVGPRELPAVLRALAHALAKLRRLKAGMHNAVETFMADADLASVDRMLAGLDNGMGVNIALNPATAMRGSLPSSGASAARPEAEEAAMQYASPEMQAYLAPPPEQPALASVEARAAPASA
jgi:sec-independent protein translocase protein TatB